MRRHSLVLFPLLVLTACPSSKSMEPEMDATPGRDATARDAVIDPDLGIPDAGVFDSGDHEDATTEPDAVALDATEDDAETPDAEPADAEEPADAGDPDSGEHPDASPPPDSGCPASVPYVDVCNTIGGAIGSFLQRCNPELTQTEAQALGGLVCASEGSILRDPTLTYSATTAAACACALQTATCTTSPDLALQACAAVATGTIAIGNACAYTRNCVPGSYCAEGGINETARAPAPDGRPNEGGRVCDGVCTEYPAPGSSCGFFGTGICPPGQECDYSFSTPVCSDRPDLGESCASLQCRGAVDTIIFPYAECDYTNQSLTCVSPPRAGGACEFVSCQALYFCDGVNCVAAPGFNDPCTLSIDVAAPNYQERTQIIDEAINVCRVRAPFYGGRGLHCVQTGATSGQGTCYLEPILGNSCGIGQFLSPRCGAGTYCAAIDPLTLAPVSGTCVPTLAAGSACSPDWNDYLLSPQCDEHTYCGWDGNGYTCLEENACSGGKGLTF